MKRIILAIISLLVLASMAISADFTIKFEWDRNTETDLAGYRMYRDINGDPGTRLKVADIDKNTGFPYVLMVTVQDGTEGTLGFVLTAYDTANNESGDSNRVTYPFDLKPPAAPGALRKLP